MKKLLGLIGAGIIVFSGCSSKNEVQKAQMCQIDNVNAPEWICTGGNVKDMITGVGSAEPTPLGFNYQRTEAISAARDEIARKISIRVKNIFKRFESSTGTGKDVTAEKATENVSKQLAYETLRNSKLLKLWKSPKGTLYVLVGMPKEDAIEGIKTSLHNKKALYQKFLAKKSWEDLDKEIDKEFNY